MFVEACAGPRGEDALASPTRCRYLTIFIIADGKKTGKDERKKRFPGTFLISSTLGTSRESSRVRNLDGRRGFLRRRSKRTANEMYTLSLPFLRPLTGGIRFSRAVFFLFLCRSSKFRRLTRSFREMSRESSR